MSNSAYPFQHLFFAKKNNYNFLSSSLYGNEEKYTHQRRTKKIILFKKTKSFKKT